MDCVTKVSQLPNMGEYVRLLLLRAKEGLHFQFDCIVKDGFHHAYPIVLEACGI